MSHLTSAWFGLVAPALVLNYFGQGALLIAQPSALENPFFLAYPEWALYPMVGLATAATVIASQATISGAYSMTQQAIQLGYLPRMAIEHTSAKTIGQIYVPAVNWTLLVVVAAAVIGFGSSTRLASSPFQTDSRSCGLRSKVVRCDVPAATSASATRRRTIRKSGHASVNEATCSSRTTAECCASASSTSKVRRSR